MMTDIVERLRRAVVDYEYVATVHDAADEIERLRALHEDRSKLNHARAKEIERLRAALEIIAGRRQCLDMLMSNQEVAHAALDGEDRK